MSYLKENGSLNLKGKIVLGITSVLLVFLLLIFSLETIAALIDGTPLTIVYIFYIFCIPWNILYLIYLIWLGNVFNYYSEKVVSMKFGEFFDTYNINSKRWKISTITDTANFCENLPRVRYMYDDYTERTFRVVFSFWDFLGFLGWTKSLKSKLVKSKTQNENEKYLKMIKENENEK